MSTMTMIRKGSPSTLQRLTGLYGPTWRPGILTDQGDLIDREGLRLHRSDATGAVWVLDPSTNEPAVPLVCSEVVEVWTEDGPISGRCGVQVRGDTGTCTAHGELHEQWAAQSPAEALAWERDLDARTT